MTIRLFETTDLKKKKLRISQEYHASTKRRHTGECVFDNEICPVLTPCEMEQSRLHGRLEYLTETA